MFGAHTDQLRCLIISAYIIYRQSNCQYMYCPVEPSRYWVHKANIHHPDLATSPSLRPAQASD
eukprot:29233-Ditylum_brightwellii.AAC.1